MTEFTVTFTAEVTAIFKDDADRLEYLMSDQFKEDARDAIMDVEPAHTDARIRDVKVFLSKEDVDDEIPLF